MVVYESKKNPLEYFRIRHLEEGNLHCHEEYEIIVCYSGKVKAIVNKKEEIISPGKLIIIFPYQLHTYKNLEDGEYRIFVFSSKHLMNTKKLTCNENVYYFESDESVYNCLKNLDKEYDMDEQYSEMLLVGYVNILMHKLIPSMNMDCSSGNFTIEQRIIEFCVKNCNQKISLSSVSSEFHIPSAKISKILKNYFGLSFPNFINNLRINNACILLVNSNLNVTEISIEVGFESIRNFNRVFNNIMGETPIDYRKKHRT